MTIKNYLSEKKELILKAAHQHGVRRIRLFGSAARGELTMQSDFDFLVEFEPGRSLFDLIDLRQDLESLLERKVDVVSERGVSPYLKEKIMKEARDL